MCGTGLPARTSSRSAKRWIAWTEWSRCSRRPSSSGRALYRAGLSSSLPGPRSRSGAAGAGAGGEGTCREDVRGVAPAGVPGCVRTQRGEGAPGAAKRCCTGGAPPVMRNSVIQARWAVRSRRSLTRTCCEAPAGTRRRRSRHSRMRGRVVRASSPGGEDLADWFGDLAAGEVEGSEMRLGAVVHCPPALEHRSGRLPGRE